MTTRVRFTVNEKVDQAPAPTRSGDGAEKRTPEDASRSSAQVVAKGLACPERSRGVKFLLDVFNETGETVAIATILTILKKLDQS